MRGKKDIQSTRNAYESELPLRNVGVGTFRMFPAGFFNRKPPRCCCNLEWEYTILGLELCSRTKKLLAHLWSLQNLAFIYSNFDFAIFMGTMSPGKLYVHWENVQTQHWQCWISGLKSGIWHCKATGLLSELLCHPLNKLDLFLLFVHSLTMYFITWISSHAPIFVWAQCRQMSRSFSWNLFIMMWPFLWRSTFIVHLDFPRDGSGESAFSVGQAASQQERRNGEISGQDLSSVLFSLLSHLPK